MTRRAHNTFGLDDIGQNRTNVWDYAGISSVSASSGDESATHLTVNQVAMIADAIRERGDIVLDGFGGSDARLSRPG